MTKVANPPIGSNPIQSYAIAEDSTFFKAISCIPIIGLAFAPSQIESLRKQTKEENLTVPKFVELVRITNQYILASAVRNVLSAALVIAGIALGIFNPIAILPAGGFFMLAAGNMHIIYKLNQIVNKELESKQVPITQT